MHDLFRILAREISKKIISLRSGDSSEDDKKIELAKYYGRFWELNKEEVSCLSEDDFINELADVNEAEKEMFKTAERYHLFNAVISLPSDFVKREIIPKYSVEERNAIYYKNLSPVRIIDNIESIKFLIELFNEFNFNPLTHENANHEKSIYDIWVLKNTLFFQNKNRETVWNLDLLKRVYLYEEIILDALALLIDKHRRREIGKFVKMFNDYYEIVNPNRPINRGVYKDYTLMQIVCLNWFRLNHKFLTSKAYLNAHGFPDIQHTFFDDVILDENDKRKSILNSEFPECDEKNHPLTVFQYLIYHHNVELLFKIFPRDLNLTPTLGYKLIVESDSGNQWDNFNLLTLFLKGLIDFQKNDDDPRAEYEAASDDSDDSDADALCASVESSKELSLYNRIMSESLKAVWCNESELSQITIQFSELNDNKLTFPVIHYLLCFANSKLADKIIAKRLFDDFYSMEVEIPEYKGYFELTAFHMLILFSNRWVLTSTYNKLGDWLNASIENKRRLYQLLNAKVSRQSMRDPHRTLFQYVILNNHYQLLNVLKVHINLKELVNQDFPIEDRLYSGWKPIQTALHEVKRTGRCKKIFDALLEIKGIDLNVCFPDNIYLRGLNILQAMVLDSRYSPDKIFPHRNFSEYAIEDLLQRLSPEQIHAVCKDCGSSFYGMNVLHIAIVGQRESVVKVLLKNDSIDYTRADANNATPIMRARHLHYTNIIHYLKEAERKFPQRLTDYRKGLKYDSEVNPNFQVTEKEWVVSILREKYSEHTFLMMEGILINEITQQITPTVRVAHLVSSAYYGKGKVKTADIDDTIEYGRTKHRNLLPRIAGRTPIIQLRPGMQFFPESDNVNSELCKAVWNEVLAEEAQDNTRYALFGNLGFLGISSSSNRGNCVDWARQKYNSLVKEGSQLSATWDMYFITTARGFLNSRFNYVAKSGNANQFENLLFQTKNLSNRQNTLITRQNTMLGIIVTLCCVLLAREINRDSNDINIFYFSLLTSVFTGVATTYYFNKFSATSQETPVDEAMSSQSLSLMS